MNLLTRSGARAALFGLALLLQQAAGCAANADEAGTNNGGTPTLSLVVEGAATLHVGERARVRAEVDVAAYLVASYVWTIEGPEGAAVSPTYETSDHKRVSFEVASAGGYRIGCRATLEDGRQAHNSATLTVLSASSGELVYTARVVPPAALGLSPTDVTVTVTDVSRAGLRWTIAEGVGVALVVEDAQTHEPLPTFVRLTRVGADPLPRDLYLGTGTAQLRISGAFDALFVPEGAAIAPALRAGLQSAQLGADWRVALDPGLSVAGSVFEAALPLAGATVTVHTRHQSGADVPSTIGVTDGAGDFTLRTRDGGATVTVVPPEGSGRPVARVSDAALSLGADALGWRFRYHDRAPVKLSATVVESDGSTAVAGATVLLRAAEIADVGSLETASGTFTARGHFRRLLRTDDAGRLFDPARAQAQTGVLVPAGDYQVELAPGPGTPATEGRALRPVSLLADADTTFELAARVALTGVVRRPDGSPARASVSVRGDAVAFVTATADDGSFSVAVDDHGRYEIVVRPTPLSGPGLGPLLLPPLEVSGSTALAPLVLPRAVALSGQLATEGGLAVAGALIRVWCSGAGCASSEVVDETLTAADGSFSLQVPPP